MLHTISQHLLLLFLTRLQCLLAIPLHEFSLILQKDRVFFELIHGLPVDRSDYALQIVAH